MQKEPWLRKQEATGHPGFETLRPELHWRQDCFERTDLRCVKRVRLIRFSSVVNEVERVKPCPATAELEAMTSR